MLSKPYHFTYLMKWFWFASYLWTPAGNKQICRLLFLCRRKSMVRYSVEHFTFILGVDKKNNSEKQKNTEKRKVVRFTNR